jgi:hypothetical protein
MLSGTLFATHPLMSSVPTAYMRFKMTDVNYNREAGQQCLISVDGLPVLFERFTKLN